MEQQQNIIMLDDYRTASQEGWNFTAQQSEAFMSQQDAIKHANSILSPDYQTGIIKGSPCGFVMWAVGIKEPS